MVEDNSKHKKAKGENKNIVATKSHKNILFNKKGLRHSMNRIQNRGHKIGTYEIIKISMPCFYEKIYI